MIDKFIGAVCNENRARLNVSTRRSSSVILAPINLSIVYFVCIYGSVSVVDVYILCKPLMAC